MPIELYELVHMDHRGELEQGKSGNLILSTKRRSFTVKAADSYLCNLAIGATSLIPY